MLTNMHPVDQLGTLLAQIADLEVQAKTLKSGIAAMGTGEHEGALFRAVVSEYDRDTLPGAKERLIEKFDDGRWVRDHTKTTAIVSVKTYTRTGIAIAA